MGLLNSFRRPRVETERQQRAGRLRSRLTLEYLEHRDLLDGQTLSGAAASAFISGLYEDLLARVPQQSEVAGWVTTMESGLTTVQAARAFVSSAEYGANLIQRDYLDLLGRKGEASAVSSWLSFMNNGGTQEQITAAFLSSQEYYQDHGSNATDWLTSVYHDVLRRPADTAGITAWTQFLGAGNSRQSAAYVIVTSPEADGLAVSDTYLHLLLRSPEPAGLSAWVNGMQHGLIAAQLTTAVAGSPEYVQDKISLPQVATTSYALTPLSSVTAGLVQSLTVSAVDAHGSTTTNYTGTIHFSSSDPAALVPPDYTFTPTDAGVHTFSVTFKTAGSRSLAAADTIRTTITATQPGITVNAAAAASFSLAGPASATAGSAISLNLTALDPYGNIATGYGGTVHFTSSDSAAVLPANYTFQSTDAGVHQFAATLKTAGSQSITGVDTTASSISGTRSGITVSTAQASLLAVSASTSQVAGSGFTVTVTAKDAFGNVAAGYTGTVHFTSSDPQAVLPSDYAFTATDGGAHSFAVTLKTAGSQSVTVTDSATASLTGKQSGISVSPASASQFMLTGLPASLAAGTAASVTVTARDAYGNVATGYNGTIHFTSTDGQAALPGNYTFASTDHGAHIFSVTFKTSGKQSMTITDQASSTVSGSSPAVSVTPAAASKLALTSASSITAGVALSVTVTARDAYGNVATGYAATIHFTSSDSLAALPADYTFTAADAGVHVFQVVLNSTGSQSLSVADGLNSLAATQTGITVLLLNPSLPPSGNFNLSTWNLTLPTGTAGHPDVISTASLLAGYTSQYFYTGTDGAMNFWAPVTGVTTSGSSYPRSELRETKSDGTLYNWNVKDGTATLDATLAVAALPSTGKIVVGQIHDNGANGVSDQPLLKLVYQFNPTTGTGILVAQVRPTPSSTSNVNYTIATNIKLGAQFSYRIQLQADLTLSVQVNGVTAYSAPIDSSWQTQGLYFKAGAYVQDNVGLSTEGGRVAFYALSVSHR
jgi:hypothetical protein